MPSVNYRQALPLVPGASWPLAAGFVSIAVALAVLLVIGVHIASRRLNESSDVGRRWTLLTAAGAAMWLALTWLVAASGLLARFDLRPPPFVLVPLSVLTLAVLMSWSPFGTRLIAGLPLAALVGLQAFRLPLELLMHRAYVEGVMPVQMSYSGRNLDILAGLTAIPVAWALHRGIAGRRLALIWNVFGALLLLNIIAVAALSTPVFAAFGPDAVNTFVAYPPFIWLPAVMVLIAITGHLLIARAVAARG
jgi:hypothetical protein